MKIFKIVSVLALAIITTACGNRTLGNDDLRTSSYDQMTDAGTVNQHLTSAQACSENPNIVSTAYQYSSQTQYRACKAIHQYVMNVTIFAADESTKNVCIFPVQVNGTKATPFIVNPNASAQNRYAVQCVTVKAAGSTASFGSLALNGVYIVDQANASLFAACLAYGDVKTCSANSGFTYSSGRL